MINLEAGNYSGRLNGYEYSALGQIYYNPNRANGYYYMEIRLYRKNSIKSADLPPNSDITLEVILNGTGLNKAKRKAYNKFNLRGLNVANLEISPKVIKVK